MNHRSAPRLVKLQEMMYLSLKETELSVDVSDKWNPDDGTVSLFIADDEENEAQVIANDIIKKLSNNILPNELCILCKQLPQNDSSQIIAELGKHQIRTRIENEYQDLIKEPIIEMLIALLRLSVDKKRPQDWEFVMSVTLDLWAADSLQSNETFFNVQDSLIEVIKILNGMMKSVKSKREFHELLKYILKFWGISRMSQSFQKEDLEILHWDFGKEVNEIVKLQIERLLNHAINTIKDREERQNRYLFPLRYLLCLDIRLEDIRKILQEYMI